MKKYYFNYLAVICVFMACSDAKDEIIPSDTTPPVITILGKNPDTVIVKTVASYNDPGATASDNKDGDITSKIVVASNVNVNVVAHWLIYYNVEDNAHNLAVKQTRDVHVVQADGTYDATSTCPLNSSTSVTITSYSNNDSIIINDFYTAGTTVKAGLNNHKYVIIPVVISGITVNGDLTANGTTLNGNITYTGTTSGSCTSTFTRN